VSSPSIAYFMGSGVLGLGETMSWITTSTAQRKEGLPSAARCVGKRLGLPGSRRQPLLAASALSIVILLS
jgi:hypothetical protein